MFKFYPNFINILNLVSKSPTLTLCQTSKWSMKCKPVIPGIDFTTQTEPQLITVVFKRLMWPIAYYSFCAKNFSELFCWLLSVFFSPAFIFVFPLCDSGKTCKKRYLKWYTSSPNIKAPLHYKVTLFIIVLNIPLECPDATAKVELYVL